jgi:hypothetical protein
MLVQHLDLICAFFLLIFYMLNDQDKVKTWFFWRGLLFFCIWLLGWWMIHRQRCRLNYLHNFATSALFSTTSPWLYQCKGLLSPFLCLHASPTIYMKTWRGCIWYKRLNRLFWFMRLLLCLHTWLVFLSLTKHFVPILQWTILFGDDEIFF